MVSVTKLIHFVALSAAVTALGAEPVAAAPRVDLGVHRTLRRQGTVNLIITLKESNKPTINSVQESSFPTRGEKIKALVDKLKKHADSTQVDITKIVAQESSKPRFSRHKSLWISNQVSFKGASIELVEQLASLPSVASIREELVLPVPKFHPSTVANVAAEADNSTIVPAVKKQWGVTKIQASDVWLAGYDGTGVVVGHIDTGVQVTHEALVSNFRGGAYGWFDPTSKKTEPYDDIGHGTLTLGSFVGSHGIGVAPGATWMACRGCTPEGCTETDLIACGQYMTCPTDATGANRDCSKAPRIINNSWGGTGGDPFYEAVIDAWQAAGIIPVFANGNTGPDCITTNSPADSPNVIAVGMTDRSDGLDISSSKGPAVSGLLKPDISAPGSGVKSAWIGEENNLYLTQTGTSIAAPYVSGVIAILLSAKPSLTYTDVRKILTATTDTANLTASGYACGDTEDTTFPNNQYGYGRVNALKAYNLATGAQATAAPTEPPSVCDGLVFFPCIRQSGCEWSDAGECEVAPPSSGSGSNEEPTQAPTEESTPEPTTPEPTTAAPTVKVTVAPTPYPTKPTPKPKPTPVPTTAKPTPAPTTASPDACKGLSFLDCFRSKSCTWGVLTFHCRKK